MVKNRKMSKASVAIIVLALLLVFSLVMGITGAWFTDTKSNNATSLQFGTVSLAALNMGTGVSVTNTIDASNEHLMPGSTVSGTVTVQNTGNSAAWLRYKIEFGGAGAAHLTDENGDPLSSAYVYVATALAGGASTTIPVAAEVPEETGNAAQNLAVTVTITVEALQQANTAATNVAATWEGVTVVAVGA